MTKKRTNKKLTQLDWCLCATAIVLITAMIILYWRVSHGSNMKTTAGMVTEIQTSSCAPVYYYDSNHRPASRAGICDAGSYLIVNGLRMIASTGLIANRSLIFDKSITDIHLGDKVKVTYIIENNQPTLHCKQCGVQILR